MSEVLIKGMKMPKACWECPLKVHLFQQLWCTPSNKVINRNDNTERELDCPLIEVPPHGDLVDRNYLISEYDRQHKGPAGGARRIMEDAPPIIEGSEE